MIKILKSITKSIKHSIKNDPEINKFYNKHPKICRFLKKRFTSNEKYGFYLTIGIISTLIFIYLFFGIVRDYIGQENLVQFDLRVINLFATFRHHQLNQQMLFITYLAKGEIIVFGLIIFSLIFYLYQKWRFLYTLIISVGIGELFVWIIKNIIERPRPPLITALVTESTSSFPSGHTFVAIAFYGLLGYFIIQSEKHKFIKIISFIFCLILISLIGISRVYLGAHWPSDVLASFMVGLAWLSILITSLKIKKKFNPPKEFKPHLNKIKSRVFSLFLIFIWISFIIFYYLNHPFPEKKIISTTKAILQSEEIKTKLFENLPKVSESITSLPAEPINLIFIGKKEILDQSFTQSGWFLLDKPNFKSYIKIITSLLFNQSYPQTPGLPVFWHTKPCEFAYGKPTTSNSISSREHIHFWETDFATESGDYIWVGTAHFDENIQRRFNIILPFHHTNIKVDDQRESIKNELQKNGFIKNYEKINLTGLMYGSKKGSGNSFLTDGQAYILYLK